MSKGRNLDHFSFLFLGFRATCFLALFVATLDESKMALPSAEVCDVVMDNLTVPLVRLGNVIGKGKKTSGGKLMSSKKKGRPYSRKLDNITDDDARRDDDRIMTLLDARASHTEIVHPNK